MRNKFFATVLALPLLAAVFAATAQSPDPVLGKWKTFDDETGKAMSITEVYRTKNGGKDKGKPIQGMLVFWDVKQEEGTWGGGRGFKPSTGDSFKVKSVKASADGKHLTITGCKLMFCREGKWERVE